MNPIILIAAGVLGILGLMGDEKDDGKVVESEKKPEKKSQKVDKPEESIIGTENAQKIDISKNDAKIEGETEKTQDNPSETEQE